MHWDIGTYEVMAPDTDRTAGQAADDEMHIYRMLTDPL
jgi:hypothetical protein